MCGLAAGQCDDDVREDVLDLLAHRKKDDDDHDRNEYQDQGVLNHTLAFLAGRQTTQFPDKVRHLFNFTSLFVDREPSLQTLWRSGSCARHQPPLRWPAKCYWQRDGSATG